ncbi:MAG TPA: hypothetical protein VK915_07935 [Gaiellaceae bacterium]|nr:hypothetical protein [Gaiellaceae bacterium]
MWRILLVAAALGLLPLGCGAEGPQDDAAGSQGSTEAPPEQGPEPAGLYEVNATILEAGDAGPMLCLGAIADSYPPQCGDVPLAGWDWDAVEGEEHAAGTTWGSYRVVGRFDGETFVVTEVAPFGEGPPGPGAPDFTTSCPEPEGGWAVVDPARVSEEDFGAAVAYAESQPESVAVWVDQPGGPSGLRILNATFTGELERHEAGLRELWGGPLCVAPSEGPTASELEQIRAEAEALVEDELPFGLLWSSGPGVEPAIEIGVVVDPGGEAQAVLDGRYGVGTVRLIPALRPVG